MTSNPDYNGHDTYGEMDEVFSIPGIQPNYNANDADNANDIIRNASNEDKELIQQPITKPYFQKPSMISFAENKRVIACIKAKSNRAKKQAELQEFLIYCDSLLKINQILHLCTFKTPILNYTNTKIINKK